MELNRNQKVILKVVIGVIVVMFLFPPYRSSLWSAISGYQFIFNLFSNPSHLINTGLLIAQLIGVCIIGGILFLFASEKEKK